jgi:hypothetical protein
MKMSTMQTPSKKEREPLRAGSSKEEGVELKFGKKAETSAWPFSESVRVCVFLPTY